MNEDGVPSVNPKIDTICGMLKSIHILDEKNKKLETQIEKMKCCSNCKNEGDYKEPYRYGTGWCNICKRHKVAKGNFDKWELKND